MSSNSLEYKKNRPGFQKNEDDFDFKKLMGRFLQYWKVYCLSLFIFVFLGLMYIRYSTPLYKVNAQVLVQDGQSGGTSSFLSSDMMADFGGMFDVQNNVYNELAILQTKDLLQKVVEDMSLNVTYYNKGDIRDVEQYKKSPYHAYFHSPGDSIPEIIMQVDFPNSGRDGAFKITSGDTVLNGHFNDTLHIANGKLLLTPTGMPFQNTTYQLSIKSVDAAIADIQENLIIELTDKETTVINLTYNTNVPRKGEDLIRNLVDAYINRNITEKNQMSDSAISFINSRIDIVSKELGGIEGDIQRFKQTNKIADLAEQAKVLINNESDYYTKLNEAEVQLNVVNTMLDYLRKEENSNRPVPYLLNNDPTFMGLVQQYNGLMLQKNRVLLSVKENNPIVENIDVQIASLRGDVLKSLQNQKKALEISRNSITRETGMINRSILNVPAQEREFVDFSRERDVKQALYLYLLQKKEETAITKASNISNASVIARPRTEVLPYFPNNILILLSSFLLGLILPTITILLRQVVNNRILTREDITTQTEAPILAEIAHSDKHGLLSMQTEGRSLMAENFRAFRTNMDFLSGQKKCVKILITSSMTGEGKSFIATNLGMLYAYSGKKVLLMELDLRKPKLSSMMGISNATGFTNYIISNSPAQDFIRPVPGNDNLFLMGSGPIPPNPAELLLSEKMDKLFAWLEDAFDVIILDSPPIGAVADAQILAKYSDINLYVIRQHYSFKYSTDIINDLIESSRIPHLYLVVNDVKKGTAYRYGYGHGAYGYGYGYVDADTKPGKKWFNFKK